MAIQRQEHYHMDTNMSGGTYGVKMTSKLFATLTDTLYSKKGEAVVRENIANCVDANDERDRLYRPLVSGYGTSVYAAKARADWRAENDDVLKHFAPHGTRFEIHLPTLIEPYISFKDFGVGLDVDQVIGEEQMTTPADYTAEELQSLMDRHGGKFVAQPKLDPNGHPVRSGGIYTTMFGSTKEDTNDQIGAYGLGCKSPYAISDTFDVNVTKNGERHMFIMFMNSNREPSWTWLTKDENGKPAPIMVDEPNGVEVVVPCAQEYMREVYEATFRILRTFPEEKQPIIHNAGGRTVEPIYRDFRLGLTYVQSNKDTSYPTHYAVSGGVAYPIELDQLEDEDGTNEVLIDNLKRLKYDTYTFFPLGTINVPPSREVLQYDRFTKESIAYYLKALTMDFDKAVDQDVEDKIRKFFGPERMEEIVKTGRVGVTLELVGLRRQLVKRWDIGSRRFQKIFDRIVHDDMKALVDFSMVQKTGHNETPVVKKPANIKKETYIEGYDADGKPIRAERDIENYLFDITHYEVDDKKASIPKSSYNYASGGTMRVDKVKNLPCLFSNRSTNYVRYLIEYHLKEGGGCASSDVFMFKPYNKDMTMAEAQKVLDSLYGAGFIQLISLDDYKPDASRPTVSALKGMSMYIGGVSKSFHSWRRLGLSDMSYFDPDEDEDENEFRIIRVDMEGFNPINQTMTQISNLWDAIRYYNNHADSKTRYVIMSVRAAGEKFATNNKEVFVDFETGFTEILDWFTQDDEFCRYVDSQYMGDFAQDCVTGTNVDRSEFWLFWRIFRPYMKAEHMHHNILHHFEVSKGPFKHYLYYASNAAKYNFTSEMKLTRMFEQLYHDLSHSDIHVYDKVCEVLMKLKDKSILNHLVSQRIKRICDYTKCIENYVLSKHSVSFNLWSSSGDRLSKEVMAAIVPVMMLENRGDVGIPKLTPEDVEYDERIEKFSGDTASRCAKRLRKKVIKECSKEG